FRIKGFARAHHSTFPTALEHVLSLDPTPPLQGPHRHPHDWIRYLGLREGARATASAHSASRLLRVYTARAVSDRAPAFPRFSHTRPPPLTARSTDAAPASSA